MNVNFEAIEKAWFKPKNNILFTKEELELLEDVFSLAIGECPSEDIKKINELEQKIKTYGRAWFKPKKTVLDELEKWINDEENPHIYYFCESKYVYFIYVDELLNKIQELKKGDEINDSKRDV